MIKLGASFMELWDTTTERALEIIGQIYDAALDPSLWTGTLQSLVPFLDVKQTVIADEDAIEPGVSVFYNSFSDPEWIELYTKSFMLINPMRIAMTGRVMAGDVILTYDFMAPADYAQTPFARDLLARRGLADIAVAILDITTTRIAVLSAHRGFEHGFADEALRLKLKWLGPHFRRALTFGRFLERSTIEANTFAQTLDKLAAPVLIVSGSGTILHANVPAIALLASGEVTHKSPGRLTLHDSTAAAELTKTLAIIENGRVPMHGEGQAIAVRGRGKTRHVMTVLPLKGEQWNAVAPRMTALAAICIKAVAFEVPSTMTALSTLYGLTRGETAVLVASVENGSIPEIAAVMGLAETTVKTHLKSVYRKTGAVRQADLVKLVAGAASPFK